MREKTFSELVSECEGAQTSLSIPFEEALQGMDGAGIGIARLDTGETVALNITGGHIGRGKDKIAQIPSFDVLKTIEGIRDLINAAGVLGRDVVSIEMLS